MSERENDPHTPHVARARLLPGLSDGPLPLIGLALVTLLAALLRFAGIATRPPGFAEAEATHALLARQTESFGLRILIESAGEASPLLAALIAIFGRAIGFDVEAARLAAALLGTLATLFTGLWLRRAAGPVWGVAGALVVAGSFWSLLFSRVALSPIAGAATLGAALWCLAEARSRSGRDVLPWHVGLGLAVGLGYLADPALRALPLVLLGLTGWATWQRIRQGDAPHLRGWSLSTLSAVLVIIPFLRANLDTPRLLTPWTPTLGLPGEAVTNPAGLIVAIVTTIRALALPVDAERLLALPGAPIFSLLVLPWAALGLVVLIAAADDADDRPTLVAWCLGLALLLVSVAAVDPGHPGRLVVAIPLLAALPVFGIRAVLGWARSPTVRLALALLAVVGLAGDLVTNAAGAYQEWSQAPETAVAFNVGTVAALREIDRTAAGEPVFISARDSGAIFAYFATTERRHTFDGDVALPIPASENGYLVAPGDAPLAAPLQQLLAGRVLDLPAGKGYRVYRIDDRIRQALPLSIPTVPFVDGTVFSGHQIELSPGAAAVAMFAWRSPPGAPERIVEARLTPVDRAGGRADASTELPANPLDGPLYQIVLIRLDVPDVAAQFDLSVSLRDADDTVIAAPGLDTDGFLFLNRYRVSGQ